VTSFKEDDIPVMMMSTLTEEGVIEVRNEVKTMTTTLYFPYLLYPRNSPMFKGGILDSPFDQLVYCNLACS